MQSKHIHLVGICGTAMASLAGMLQQREFKVTGSDAAAYPPMSDFLKSLGIPVLQPFSADNFQPRPGLVIIGNAISRGNVELEYVLDQRIPFQSMPQLLWDEFLRDKERLVVAGTHGKTTTSSMLSWIFHHAGRAPNFLIGGIPENFGSSFALSSGHEFILEGDEYDTAFFDKGPKFLHYFPDAAILTSVEFDHADIYKNLAEVKTAFKRLVNLVPQRGLLVAWDGHPNVDECVNRAFCRVERYGFGERSHWRITDISYLPQLTHWRVHRNNFLVDTVICSHGRGGSGIQYVVLAGERKLELSPWLVIAAALQSFRSVKRRLEVKAEIAGITMIDDFAHHPTAIAETLKAIRSRYAGRRLWAILEPRSNTLRRNVFQDELVQSLALADEIVLADVFRSSAIPEDERLDPAKVVASLNAMNRPARLLTDADSIVAAVASELRSGDVVAILSNGGFGGIYEKLPAKLKSLYEVTTAS